MVRKDLGMIKEVDLREIFEREDAEFTPWLNENLKLLTDKIGIEILDNRTEEPIGDFKADIIGKDADSEKIVIIENEMEVTDHQHLGKLLTYAAGTKAGIIVWIAKEFREEHRSVLEWLNENSGSEVSFFGVKIKAIAIDGSKPAVDFDVVVKPDEWERNVRELSKPMDENQRKRLQFFSKLAEEYIKVDPTWRKVKPKRWHSMNFGAGKSGLRFSWRFRSNNRFSVGLYIDTGNETENERIFEDLEEQKERIEEELGFGELSWERLEKKRACRIALNRTMKENIKNLSEEDQEELIKWATTAMKKFTDTFSNYIKEI